MIGFDPFDLTQPLMMPRQLLNKILEILALSTNIERTLAHQCVHVYTVTLKLVIVLA